MWEHQVQHTGVARFQFTQFAQSVPIALPDLATQLAICRFLDPLDEKIAHDRLVASRLLRTLGLMFQRLVSEGRERSQLGDQVEVIMGQSPPGSTYSNDASVGVPLVQGMGAFGDRFPQTKVFTSAPTKHALPGDVLMTVRAPVGEVNVADREYCAGRGVAIIRGGHPAYTEQLMRHLQATWVEHESGTIYPSVNRAQIVSLQAPSPRADAVVEFESQARPLYELIGNLAWQRARLAGIREALLPKLVSGKLRVPEEYVPA